MRHANIPPGASPRQDNRTHMAKKLATIVCARHKVDALSPWRLVVFPCPPSRIGGMMKDRFKQLARLMDRILAALKGSDVGWHGSSVWRVSAMPLPRHEPGPLVGTFMLEVDVCMGI